MNVNLLSKFCFSWILLLAVTHTAVATPKEDLNSFCIRNSISTLSQDTEYLLLSELMSGYKAHNQNADLSRCKFSVRKDRSRSVLSIQDLAYLARSRLSKGEVGIKFEIEDKTRPGTLGYEQQACGYGDIKCSKKFFSNNIQAVYDQGFDVVAIELNSAYEVVGEMTEYISQEYAHLSSKIKLIDKGRNAPFISIQAKKSVNPMFKRKWIWVSVSCDEKKSELPTQEPKVAQTVLPTETEKESKANSIKRLNSYHPKKQKMKRAGSYVPNKCPRADCSYK